jgi:hypothetical protein
MSCLTYSPEWRGRGVGQRAFGPDSAVEIVTWRCIRASSEQFVTAPWQEGRLHSDNTGAALGHDIVRMSQKRDAALTVAPCLCHQFYMLCLGRGQASLNNVGACLRKLENVLLAVDDLQAAPRQPRADVARVQPALAVEYLRVTPWPCSDSTKALQMLQGACAAHAPVTQVHKEELAGRSMWIPNISKASASACLTVA